MTKMYLVIFKEEDGEYDDYNSESHPVVLLTSYEGAVSFVEKYSEFRKALHEISLKFELELFQVRQECEINEEPLIQIKKYSWIPPQGVKEKDLNPDLVAKMKEEKKQREIDNSTNVEISQRNQDKLHNAIQDMQKKFVENPEKHLPHKELFAGSILATTVFISSCEVGKVGFTIESTTHFDDKINYTVINAFGLQVPSSAF